MICGIQSYEKEVNFGVAVVLIMHWHSPISEMLGVQLITEFIDNFVFHISQNNEVCRICLNNKEGRQYGFVTATESCQHKYFLAPFLHTIRNWRVWVVFFFLLLTRGESQAARKRVGWLHLKKNKKRKERKRSWNCLYFLVCCLISRPKLTGSI